MPLYTLDPILDRRWDDLVASHPRASVFHSRGWLKALADTYNYHPIVVTSTPAARPLADGIVFCEIKSWVTGTRLVSLPFADHCEPLLNEMEEPLDLTECMKLNCFQHPCKYVEFRPISSGIPTSGCPLAVSQSFWFHTLDLAPPLKHIFSNLHKNSIQRRIRHAERELLSYEKGCSKRLLEDFYRLLIITRRRHCLPPQPIAWFYNLVRCMSPDLQIRLVRKDDIAIAAILTLRHRGTAVYKYGCSDAKFHHLAGMPLLFWKLIEESKVEGADHLDLGRTDLDNEGLTDFKDRLGAIRRRLSYLRYPENSVKRTAVSPFLPMAHRLFSVMPGSVSSIAGRMLYRHIG